MRQGLIQTIISLMGICSLPMAAETHTDSVLINFHQSKINLDTAYMDNARSLSEIGRSLKIYADPDSGYSLKAVRVVGAASPEGSVRFNEWLSRQRAERIFDHLSHTLAIPDSITSFTFLGRDWQGLHRLVELDSEVPYRIEVLETLDDIIARNAGGEKESAGNLARIKRLRGGVPYLYMYRHLFPTLRASRLALDFTRPDRQVIDEVPVTEVVIPPCEPDTVLIMVHDTVFVPTYVCRPFYMALKTNLLFDALAVPNISAEFYLGKNLSAVANWMYGWWDNNRTHRYWRIYGGDLALRWWFGKKAHEKPLQGHHIGIYAGIVTYDFEFGGRGYMGGIPKGTLWDRCNRYAGIEYGYSLPIKRRLNLDFTLGLGYLGGKYITYNPQGKCYIYEATHKRSWFGPTKAEVSLVWLIGCDNYNVKGGRK